MTGLALTALISLALLAPTGGPNKFAARSHQRIPNQHPGHATPPLQWLMARLHLRHLSQMYAFTDI